jgi:hypothetical protein
MPGTKSICIWSAGRNTGAPQDDRVPSDCETDAVCVVDHQRDAAGIGFPDENWGRSDVLRERGEGSVDSENHSRIGSWDWQYVHGEESAFRQSTVHASCTNGSTSTNSGQDCFTLGREEAENEQNGS